MLSEFLFTDCQIESRNDAGAWVIAPNGKKYFYYLIRLDEEGHETLRWLNDRGYDCGVFDLIEPTNLEDNHIAAIRENAAWRISEESQDGGFDCLNWDSETGKEIRRFLESIV